MTFRWTEEALLAFEKRRKEYEAQGRIRTHICADEAEIKVPVLGAPARRNGRPKKEGKPKLAERSVLKACVKVLNVHPKVALAWRQNSGLAFGQGQAVRFSFKGCSDILGMLVGGRFFACEVKATGKVASADQAAFLAAVNASGGLGVCVDDPQRLIEALEAA